MMAKKCKATLELSDDYGDNCTTFHCQLPPKHFGLHREMGAVFRKYCVIWSDKPLRAVDTADKLGYIIHEWEE
jgi:hypothetical protein